MKISTVNSLENKIGSFKDSLERSANTNDSVEDRAAQGRINDKIKEIEEILSELKINNNSSAAKVLKWFKENCENYTHQAQFIKVSATEKSFTIAVNAAYLGLDLSSDEDGNDNNKFDMKRYDKITSKAEFYYRSRWDNKKKHPLKEMIKDIEEQVQLDSVSAYYNVFEFDFNYSKKIFKDEEAVKDIFDILMKSFTAYLNSIKTDLDNGVYNPPVRKARGQ